MDGRVVGAYLESAFDQMLEVARRCGRHLDERPHGEGTNSVASLVVHCCEVTEFWIGHAALGRPSVRDRDAEFDARAGLVQLETRVGATVQQLREDLERLEAGEGVASDLRQFLPGGPGDDSVLLHVAEELFQHLGHMELTVDALAARGLLDEPLHHLALLADWEAAIASPERTYEISTRGRALAEVGFIHCSYRDQVARTAARFYADRDDVVVLRIDPAQLAVPVRVEDLEGAGEQFPHLYGPLPVDAVSAVEPLDAFG